MARLIGSLAFVWVLAGGRQSARPSVPWTKQAECVVGAGRGVRVATSPEKSTVAVRALSVASRRWVAGGSHQVEGMWRPWKQREALALQKPTRGMLGPGAELPTSERRTSDMGDPGSKTRMAMLGTRFLLCKFRMKDEEGSGDLLLCFPRKMDQGYLTSLPCFEDQKAITQIFCQPPSQQRLWFLTVKENKDNDANNSYCICTASAGKGGRGRRPLHLSLAQVRTAHNYKV